MPGTGERPGLDGEHTDLDVGALGFLGTGIYLAVMDRQSSWSALPLNAAIVGGIVFGLAALLDGAVTRPVAMWTLWLVGLGVSITVFWPYLS
ncbi:hypothetical protein ACFWIO_03200 [Streptomyces diastatochromogenes]|uniref:hypothetical protein n=1 Tax=Streptomyces diastatochromogenes TaxID=42236 RepID=UPI00364BC6F3